MSLSDDLAVKIQQVLDEHLRSEGGGMSTGFHFVADFIDSEGGQSWIYATAPDQRMSVTLGLLKWSMGCAEYEQRRYLDQISDEDD